MNCEYSSLCPAIHSSHTSTSTDNSDVPRTQPTGCSSGHAIAQAVHRRLQTAAAQVRAQVKSW
jgi:hypothetical protein